MLNRKSAFVVSAALLLAAAPSPAISAETPLLPDADPAMWVVKDRDTTIYLFGTFHVMDGKADWFNDDVKAAFDRSEEVVLEANLPDDPSTVAPLVQKYAIDPSGKPLTTKLSPEAQAKLGKLLGAMGAPATAFDKFRPMFATMSLAMAPYQALGMTAEKGAEKTLTAAAKAGNKKLRELEGFEAQLKMLNEIPEPAQIEGLEKLLADFDKAPDMIRSMVTYWNAGDAEGFANLMKEMQADSPAMYKVLMTDRNERWADWIDQRLDRPGTVFLGVGTAHLAGKDSVQQFLENRGINSLRSR